MNLTSWVPMRWPCGPLAVERLRRREAFTPEEMEALRAWADPRTLECLSGSPVNALVVPWAEGSAGDEGHQQTLAPLIGAARGRGLSVVGWLGETADVRKAAGAARAAGLAALATSSLEPVEGMDVLRFRKRGFEDRTRADFVGDLDAVWPGMRPLKLEPSVDAVSGATARPWIDSNAWYVRLARTLLEPQCVWLAFDPPETGWPATADGYLQAIADTEVCGARWMVSLDAKLRLGLAEGRKDTHETWASITRSLSFFRKHASWAGLRPVGQIGVVSDYAGAHEFLSFEVLNLLGRRSGLYRVLDKGRVDAAALQGLDAVLYADEAPAEADLARRLYAFAEQGGTLVTPQGWKALGEPVEGAPTPRFRVFRLGQGRLAVAREAFDDPDLLAEDLQLLAGHRNDRVRVFNLGVGHVHYATSGDGRSGVLHSFAFPTPYRRQEVTLWFRSPWAEARLFQVAEGSVAEGSGAAVPRAVADGGVEFHLPPVPPYCAVEVSA
ncbi:MAG TPA: hypothetical protein VGB87_14515 [Vicinamibacteria bacterium]